jgi:hypothetical protein
MTFRRGVHRVLLLAALGLSLGVVYSIATGFSSGDAALATIFRETPDRNAGFVVLLACALFFPPFASLAMVVKSWSRSAVHAGTFARYFCFVSGLLHGFAARMGPEAPAHLLAASATVFIGAGITAPPSRASDLPPPAVEDRAHQFLGWMLLASSLGFGAWTIAQLIGVADLSVLWGKKDADALMEAVFLPPIVAVAMLANRRWRTARKRQQGRVAVRMMCIGSAFAIGHLLFTGWGLPSWAPVVGATLFAVAAMVPWGESPAESASEAPTPERPPRRWESATASRPAAPGDP